MYQCCIYKQRNSGINFQLRLVYTHHTPTYRDTGKTCGQVISALQDRYDDNMDDVHDIRNLWGADAVALLTGPRVSGCGGVAYVGHYSPYSFSNWMFSVTLAPYATGGTFGHEVGHNMGCLHDRLESGNPDFEYEYGWHDPQGRFRVSAHNWFRLFAFVFSAFVFTNISLPQTIMAYNCPGGCPRVQAFSNTEFYANINGEPLPMGNAQNDCARKHNEVKEQVASYRRVRITESPTKSESPSVSTAPTFPPTKIPTLSPTISSVPSIEPSVSLGKSSYIRWAKIIQGVYILGLSSFILKSLFCFCKTILLQSRAECPPSGQHSATPS